MACAFDIKVSLPLFLELLFWIEMVTPLLTTKYVSFYLSCFQTVLQETMFKHGAPEILYDETNIKGLVRNELNQKYDAKYMRESSQQSETWFFSSNLDLILDWHQIFSCLILSFLTSQRCYRSSR